jgi:protein arginine kinase
VAVVVAEPLARLDALGPGARQRVGRKHGTGDLLLAVDPVGILTRVVGKVVDYERSARSMMLREAPGVLEDKVWRAYGILQHARSLSAEEMMNLLSALRLGISLKLLRSPRVETLNEILVFGQTAHLEEAAGGTLVDAEADAARAAYVRTRLESDES